MGSEKFYKILVAGCTALCVVTAGLLVYVYTCDWASSSNKLQAWSTLGVCSAALFNAKMQLRKKKRK